MKQLMKTFAGPDPTPDDIARLASIDIDSGLNQVFRSLSPSVTLTQTTLDNDDWNSLERIVKFFFRLSWKVAKKFAREPSQVKLDAEDYWTESVLVLADKLTAFASKQYPVKQFASKMAVTLRNHFRDVRRRETGLRKRNGEVTGNKVWTNLDGSIFDNPAATRPADARHEFAKVRPPTGPEMEDFVDSTQDLMEWTRTLAADDVEVMTNRVRFDLTRGSDSVERELAVRFKSLDACRGQRNGTAKARASELGDIFHNRWNPNYEPNFTPVIEGDDGASNGEGRTGVRPRVSYVGGGGNDHFSNPCYASPKSKPCTQFASHGNRQRSSRPVKFVQRDAEWIDGHPDYKPLRCGGANG